MREGEVGVGFAHRGLWYVCEGWWRAEACGPQGVPALARCAWAHGPTPTVSCRRASLSRVLSAACVGVRCGAQIIACRVRRRGRVCPAVVLPWGGHVVAPRFSILHMRLYISSIYVIIYYLYCN